MKMNKCHQGVKLESMCYTHSLVFSKLEGQSEIQNMYVAQEMKNLALGNIYIFVILHDVYSLIVS